MSCKPPTDILSVIDPRIRAKDIGDKDDNLTVFSLPCVAFFLRNLPLETQDPSQQPMKVLLRSLGSPSHCSPLNERRPLIVKRLVYLKKLVLFMMLHEEVLTLLITEPGINDIRKGLSH